MDILAAIVAIAAIIFALNVRKRVSALEVHLTQLNGRLDLNAAGATRSASNPSSFPEQTAVAPPEPAAPAVQSSSPAEKTDEAGSDAVFAAAAQHSAATAEKP